MKVAFACSTIFHFEHMKQVFEQFNDSIVIVFNSLYDFDKNKALELYLKDKNIEFYHISDIIKEHKTVDVLFSVFWQPAFLVLGSNTFHMRIMYGYAKDYWNYADWNMNYDLIFTYGPYATERLNLLAPCVEVGNPRVPFPLVKNFNELRDVQGEKIESIGQGNRKVILYCPTWGELSSIKYFDRQLPGLLVEYDVIVKLHHLSSYTNYSNLVRFFNNRRIAIFDERTNLFDLLLISDLVISDYSGAIFDAMLLEKKILLLNMDPPVKEENYRSDASNSLDRLIRQFLPHCSYNDGLIAKINETIESPISYKEFLAQLYSKHYKNAAQEIVDYASKWFAKNSSANRLKCLVDKITKFISEDNREIIICGAGEFGQAFLFWIKENTGSKVRIVDSDTSKHGQILNHVEIESIIEIMNKLDRNTSKFLIATVSGAQSYAAIFEQSNLSYQKDYIYLF
ncbi:CDP-glycerol glycerophosphotransferase family protein [Neobacillus sp.]|uniref:CDP-glycerol glycerophosphotransferase family protein n=1 Tax=Neobacillus sp. TaxID=2675273 RepID=UPI0035B50FD3